MTQQSDQRLTTITERYLALPPMLRAAFIADLQHELTIVARMAYEVGGTGADGTRLREVNEAQHRLSSHLVGLLRKTADEDETWFLQWVVSESPAGGPDRQMENAVDRSLSRVESWMPRLSKPSQAAG